MTPIENLLQRLDKVTSIGNGRYKACCPAHDDKTTSMALTEAEEGKVLIHFFAGCIPAEIIAAVGLSIGELFPEGENNNWNDYIKKYNPAKDRHTLKTFQTMRDSGMEITELDINQAEIAVKRIKNEGRI